MDNYIDKGLMFPEKEWWDERKTDLSFLYATADSEGGTSLSNIVESEAEFSNETSDLNTWKENLAGESGETRISKTSGSTLDEWVKEMRNEGRAIKPTITSLAGYINIAYPIIKSLKPSSPNSDVNLKETERKLRKIGSNLQTVVETVDNLQTAISNTQLPAGQAEELKNLVQHKSKAILEKCETANVLTNMVKSISHIYDPPPESNSVSKIFGSSLDLL